MNSSLDNQHFSGEQNKKSAQTFTMFTQSYLSEYMYLRIDIETTEIPQNLKLYLCLIIKSKQTKLSYLGTQKDQKL